MKEADLHELAAPYAVDALDPGESRAFEAHLHRCASCRAEVAQLQEAVVSLSDGLEVAPPADLRRRVLDAVAADAATAKTAEAATVTTAAAADAATARTAPTLVQGGQAGSSAARRPGGQHRSRTAGSATTGRRWWLAAAAAVVVGAGAWGATQLGGDPATRIVQAQDAQEHEAETADGQLVVITSTQEDAAVLRLPEDLAAPGQGQVYQAWFVGADGTARSAGLLGAEALDDGQAVLEGTPSGAVAVGLTVEPAAGSAQPTSEPFAVVPLG